MSYMTIYKALGLAPGQIHQQTPRSSPISSNARARYPLLFTPGQVGAKKLPALPCGQIQQMPTRKPVPFKCETWRSRPDNSTDIPRSQRLDALLDRSSRRTQILSSWPAGEAFETYSNSSHDSGCSGDSSFHRMLDEFPEPPCAVPPQTRPNNNYLGELQSWGWAENTHLSGSTVFGVDWNALVESREVMVPPTNLDHYSKATSNISIVNRITAMRNSGPLHTFFDDASLIASPTLHPKRWSIPASCTAKRESALSKAKVVAKKFAKKLNCFSWDEEDDDGKGRKGSTSTVSTIVSSIAEITDAVSQMKWRSYFRKIDERRRIRKSSRVNFGGSKPTAEAFSQSTPSPD